MSELVDTVDTDHGNTKERDLRSRAWFLTWNNPEDYTVLIELFEVSGCERFIFQEEIGDNMTRHFQGLVYYKNARSFNSMKVLCKEIHWEVAHDVRKAIKYCCKVDTRSDGPWSKGIKIPKGIKIIDPNEREWQKKLLEELIFDSDDRKIVWYTDPIGGSGKTQMAKYLVVKHKALVVSGKATDIKFAVIKHLEKNPSCDILIFLFPRTVEGYVSYDAIESLKDGLFFSGKYESGMAVFDPPHVICMANFAPDRSMLSADRWDIRELSKDPYEDIGNCNDVMYM